MVAALAGGSNRSLVFTRTKHGAQKLTRQLARDGVSVVELHGNLGQGARERNLASFSAGTARVLVATDIAARGIHVDGIDLVIHADPPSEHKAYLHRSGRTARAGAEGVVDHRAEPGPGRRRAGADAPRGREPAGGQRQPWLGPAPLHRRAAGRPGGGPRTARRRGNGPPGQPGHRPWRGGHVGRLPGAPQAVNIAARRAPLADAGTGRRRGNTLATRRRLTEELLSTFAIVKAPHFRQWAPRRLAVDSSLR